MTEKKGLGTWLILVLLCSFSVLLYCGTRIFDGKPPLPGQVLAPDGSVMTTGERITRGQQIFLNNQLMDYGTILGHGSYYGPDFTALAIHELSGTYAGLMSSSEAVISEFKTNLHEMIERFQEHREANKKKAHDQAMIQDDRSKSGRHRSHKR